MHTQCTYPDLLACAQPMGTYRAHLWLISGYAVTSSPTGHIPATTQGCNSQVRACSVASSIAPEVVSQVEQ